MSTTPNEKQSLLIPKKKDSTLAQQTGGSLSLSLGHSHRRNSLWNKVRKNIAHVPDIDHRPHHHHGEDIDSSSRPTSPKLGATSINAPQQQEESSSHLGPSAAAASSSPSPSPSAPQQQQEAQVNFLSGTPNSPAFLQLQGDTLSSSGTDDDEPEDLGTDALMFNRATSYSAIEFASPVQNSSMASSQRRNSSFAANHHHNNNYQSTNSGLSSSNKRRNSSRRSSSKPSAPNSPKIIAQRKASSSITSVSLEKGVVSTTTAQDEQQQQQDAGEGGEEEYEEEEEPETPVAPPYRYWKLLMLCLCVIFLVGSPTEGSQSYSQVLVDRGIYFEKCHELLPIAANNSNNISVTSCPAQKHKIGSTIDLGLSVMNVIGIVIGPVADLLGFKMTGIVGSLLWAGATSIGGINPEEGTMWTAAFSLQSCAAGILFLAIFTGGLKQLFPEEKEFALASAFVSSLWDFGALFGYTFRFWFGIESISITTLFVIIGLMFGLPSALGFGTLFRPPDREGSIEQLKIQIKQAKEIISKPVFWLLTLNFTVVCVNGYFVIGYIGELLENAGATAEEIKVARPWVSNIVAFSAPAAVIPGYLMNRAGIFGGMGVTCLILSVLAVGILLVSLFGGAMTQYVMLGLMAVWRTMNFTTANAGLPVCFIDAPYAIGLAFGLMTTVAGAVSTLVGIFMGGAIQNGGNNPAHLKNSSHYNTNHTHPSHDAEYGSIAPPSTFVWVNCVLWGSAIIAPLLLAYRCFQLQSAANTFAAEEKERKKTEKLQRKSKKKEEQQEKAEPVTITD